MFSNTAYEAMYQYLGLKLHERFLEILTSDVIFQATILITFAILFFITTVRFTARYLPGAVVSRQTLPLSAFVKITLCLVIGLSLLRVQSHTTVKSFLGVSWHTNTYVKAHVVDIEPKYKVSFIFRLLSQTAEEIAAFSSRVVDRVFESTHSNLRAPDFFFKAIMYGGVTSIEDQALRGKLELYTESCFDRVLGVASQEAVGEGFKGLFLKNGPMDHELRSVRVKLPDGRRTNCLRVKNETLRDLETYARSRGRQFARLYENVHSGFMGWSGAGNILKGQTWNHLHTSNALLNYYIAQRENNFGVKKGALLPDQAGQIYQHVSRLSTIEGILHFFTGGRSRDISTASERALKFNEQLSRAPHLAGFIKLILIAVFPFLVFFVVAGQWKLLVYWFFVYLSVLLWTPIWTLFYHIMVNLTLAADTMAAFGELYDGISLYSAELLSSRIYEMYAVYSWLQILIGPSFSLIFLMALKPIFRPAFKDIAPEESPSWVGSTATALGPSKITHATGFEKNEEVKRSV